MAVKKTLRKSKNKTDSSSTNDNMLFNTANYWRSCLTSFDFSPLSKKNGPKPGFKIKFQEIAEKGALGNISESDEAFAILYLICNKKTVAGRKFHPLFALPVNAVFDKGTLSPDINKSILFNHEYLGPDSAYFILGENRDLCDQYLKAISGFKEDETQSNSWRSWWSCVENFLQTVFVDNNSHGLKNIFSEILNDSQPSNGSEPSNYSLELHIFGTSFSAVKQLDNIYESIPREYNLYSKDLALFKSLFSDDKSTILIGKSSKHFSGISAHMDEYDVEKQKRVLYPLDESQRLAVNCIVNLKVGQMQAVNGPPGSGKTSMLKAVIASNWVNAILEDKPCPITVACGATNQSVTNVISAFGSIAHPNMDNPFWARWVEGVPSYGAYFPSQSKIIDGSAANFLCFGMNYQDSFLFKFIGDHNALDPLLIDSNKSFYLSCASTAFNQNFKDISEVLKALKKKLKYLNKLLELSLNSPSSREQAFIELKRYTLVNKELWDEDSRYKFADELLTKYEKDSNEFSLDDCDRLIDVVLRPELFHISARYWEGKFILSQRELLLSRHPKNLEEALRRLCMLTPCLVSTLHTVGKLAALPKDILEDNDGRSHLFGLFDLLIIDESGQALPELGGAAIALAKRAAIVGDLKQIAPVSSHNELSEKKISQMVFTDEQIELNNFSGRSTLNGSVLAMARKRSVYREPADDGVTLSYHYRCKPSIVEYCNQLSYNGNLVTRTSDDAGKSLLPAMAWVNVDAKAEKVEGSYQNSAEAKEIAEWIVESWPVWQVHEDSKGKPIYDVVAVITPYKRQEKILCSALEKAFNIARKSAKDESNFPSQKEVKDITVGTVHKLQGAERPFVCFSLVEGPDKITNSFVDKTESIMNVAVSRAKKSFIIFANPKRLFPDQSLLISQNIKISDKPVLFLGEYLRKEFKHASHIRMLYPEYLVLIEAEGKVDSLQKVLGKKAEVLDTGGALLSIKQVKGFKKDRLEKNASLIPVFQSKLKEKDNKRLKIEEALKNIDECILATDDDAMGEYIAWQCLLEFSPLMQSKSISRVRLQATTPECIDHAFNSKSELNIGLVTSELLRDMTDFMFMKRCIELKKNALKLSSDQSLLSSFYQIGAIHESAKEFDEAFSMGRVQLAVLGVLYEGMSSVANFKNVKKIEVTLSSEKGTVKGILGRKSLNGDIRYFSENKTLEGSIHKLEKCAITEKIQMPSYRETMDVPIASTINVLRACWAKYGILPNDSMTAMQRLYRGDWCDQTKLNDLKLQNYKSVDIKAKNGSGHPPIQPMLDLPPSQLMNVNIKNIFEVYSIIWEINEALKNKDEFFILHSNREYQLDTKSSAFIVRFENKKLSEPARKVAYLWGINKFQLNDFDAPLCDFPEHMNTSGLGWSIQPAVGWDMSFDSLMEIMKDYGVGRPSTYHSLFNTLINKKMIEVDMAESVRLTPKGFEIINRFSRLSSNLCGYEFTRMAYAQMDLISNGDIDPPEYFQTMIPRLFSDNVDETTHSDVNLSDTWKSIDEIFEFNVNEGMSV